MVVFRLSTENTELFRKLGFYTYTHTMLHTLKLITKLLIICFAIIGFVMISGYLAIRLGFTKTSGMIDTQTKTFLNQTDKNTYTQFTLAHTPEWIAFRQAVSKDKLVITKVSKETGVPERILISLLVPEQMRLFYSNRPIFKQVFEPLKVLGSQSQFSWGIFGIKDDTARLVEAHLLDKKSPYYLGPSFEKALSFKTSDSDQERFARIIDEHDHTYSYLYTALYIAQINKQWETAGFPIKDKPEILATIWNLGFSKSNPNKNPLSGGSSMDINGKEYSFGALASEFYYSDELIEIFPKQ